MTIDGEPAKILLPYLQRADELQKHDHLAAYYCRLYAMEKGLKIPTKERTNETKLILISLMNQLEKDKKVVKLSPDDNMYMEGFALRVFAKADKQDRAGRADLKTAMTFYAASIFLEVLLQFGELPPDIQEKQKYASWKAVDIRKALAEGRKPVPGPPVTEKDAFDGEDPTVGTEGNTSSPPKTQQQKQHPPLSPPSEPSSGAFQHDSPSKSSEDFNLPSAPSNAIPPPSYTQNPYAPVDNDDNDAGYPPPSAPSHHPPFASSGGPYDPKTIGTYSYPSDPPGFTTGSTSDFTTSPPPNHNSWDPRHHHPQQQQPPPQWPSGSASPYHSVFPSASPASPASHPHYPSSRHSELPPGASRTSSGAGGESGAGSGYPAGYQLNGSYDSEYKPSPGQVVEAHKASRFAVSALAFDDIPTAISYLRKSLELLTSPSAVE